MPTISLTLRRTATVFALVILFCAGVLAYSAGWNDTAIVDEVPHIGSGITYVTEYDMRLNPEHPPLVKDLAALPLLFVPGLTVPTHLSSWTQDVNGQWEFGRVFIFESGNNADLIIRLARIAPTLIMLLLGWFVFRWTRERAGALAGFLALIFYVTSPIVLAHGKLVTTDVPAAAGVFIATYFFIRYLTRPTRKNLLWAGVSFGLAQLTKFSVALLVPYFGLLALLWTLLTVVPTWRKSSASSLPRFLARSLPRFLYGTAAIGLIGLLVIFLVYIPHVIGYPEARQVTDMQHILASFPQPIVSDTIITMAHIEPLRPLAQYLFGLAMVFQRATGGNTTFFMGDVSGEAWASYFPVVYLIKTPLAFHLLTLIALAVAGAALFRKPKNRASKRQHIDLTQERTNDEKNTKEKEAHSRLVRSSRLAFLASRYFPELAMLIFIALYWYTSITSNLNIGVRHLLPTFPFIFLLVAKGSAAYLKPSLNTFSLASLLAYLQKISFRAALISLLVFWLVLVSLIAWPFYLASFNELVLLRPSPHPGLAASGANWATDSNLDWGQDLKRLAHFVEENNIDRIAVDYFGWAPSTYYIQDAEVIPWNTTKGQPEGWFAVSATFKQESCARPTKGFDRNTTGYCFLQNHDPVTIIGGSIYVYHF